MEKQKKPRDKKFFASIIVFILILGFVTYFHFKKIDVILSETELPKIEIPKIDFPFLEKPEGYKNFVSQDGKMEITYPADWTDSGKEAFMSFEFAYSEILFFAFKSDWNKKITAFFTVQELIFEEKTGFEEILERIKRETEENGGKVTVLNSEILNEKTGVFEMEYQIEETPDLYRSKKKIFLNEKTYLISFFAFKKDWQEFEKEADEILSSVKVAD